MPTRLRYIYKIHSSRLRKSKWNLDISIREAIDNEEIVSLAESTALRFIDDINNFKYDESKIKIIRRKINNIKHELTNAKNKKKIATLYDQLYDLTFVKDYICVVIDKNQDYDRMNKDKRFYVGGIKFRRLLATTGGSKNSTVVFVNEDIYKNLHDRIENGRNKDIKFVPAKLEAYKSLTCSASIPVSDPSGVLVVKDCETTFKANVIRIDDTGEGTEPIVENKKDYEITLNESDGYGLILPELSEKWGKELGEKYLSSGFCIRNSFCKGMLFSFNFLDFASNVAKDYMVMDAWGNTQDIRKVEIVLTTSMLKLWESYTSIEHYLKCCKDNGYTFSITKILPEKLENERNLNYQFIQSLNLSDKNIEELIKPTVDEIKDVLSGDWRKSLLFLKGINLDDRNFNQGDPDFTKALMVEKEMIYDPFVKTKIYNMIKKKINDSKVGVLKVKSNFSIISGDPFSLCQSMFGLKVTGLLNSGEFYSDYWNKKGEKKVACFRAPMTCHNNIRILRLKNTEILNHWYKYMKTCTIFNSWDTTADALNGADKDSDSVFTTAVPSILQSIEEMNAIICVQKTAQKSIPTEQDLIIANKNSFGDSIGSITNKITSMFDVRSKFEKNSKEHKELDKRICCGQNYQQNAIDKAKGIESKSMPKEWYDFHVNKNLDEVTKKFNLSILADKKPYFFIYIYPHVMKEYKNFVENARRNSIRRFGLSIDELLQKETLTDEQSTFLKYYEMKYPVFKNPSVMNKVCWKLEDEFDSLHISNSSSEFDYKILGTGKSYKQRNFIEVKELYDKYRHRVNNYIQLSKKKRIDEDERREKRANFINKFKREAFEICNNSEDLCNIVLDICYKKSGISKQFAWDICGSQIIKNLLTRNDNLIQYPIPDENGNIEFNGERYRMQIQRLEGEIVEDYIE